MVRTLIFVLVGLSLNGPLLSADAADKMSEAEKLALANFHSEMIECHVYYLFAAELFRKEPKQDKGTIEKLERTKDILLERIKALGRTIGILDEAAAATMRLLYRQQLREINNDSLNFSILIEKHADLCKVVVERSDARIKHWMDQAKKN